MINVENEVFASMLVVDGIKNWLVENRDRLSDDTLRYMAGAMALIVHFCFITLAADQKSRGWPAARGQR